MKVIPRKREITTELKIILNPTECVMLSKLLGQYSTSDCSRIARTDTKHDYSGTDLDSFLNKLYRRVTDVKDEVEAQN